MGQLYIGNHLLSIDEKGRMTIPAKFRKDLGGKVVLSLSFDGNLEIRSKASFKEWAAFLNGQPQLNLSAQQLRDAIFGNSEELEIDQKGRILIPGQISKVAGLDKQVNLIGAGDRVRIISAAKWIEFQSNQTSTLLAAAKKLDESK